MRNLLLFILLVNRELYSKNAKHEQLENLEQSTNELFQIHRKQKKAFCSLSVKDTLNVGHLAVCGNSCLNNLTITGTETVNGTLQVNGSLMVNGTTVTPCANECITAPSTSTNNALVLFSGTTGNILKQSPAPITIDETNNLNAVNNITISGNLNMVTTPSDLSAGVITKNNQPFIYDLGNSTCTFIGVNAGLASPNSFSNTGIGLQALGSLASGSFNTAIGRETMHFGTSGSFNTALGALSLIQSTASFNTALGYNTLQGLAGNGNVAVGASALQNTTGTLNTAIGFQAGSALTAGTNNIYIGANTGTSLGIPVESTTIRIGNTGVQIACFIAGINGAALGASAVPILVDNTGQLGTAVSSRRYKKDINDMGDRSSQLAKLRPVTFTYKSDIEKSDSVQYGLIAEEVAEIYPDLVVYNKDNEPESVKYHVLNSMLLNELNKFIRNQQEHEGIIKKLLIRIDKLEQVIRH